MNNMLNAHNMNDIKVPQNVRCLAHQKMMMMIIIIIILVLLLLLLMSL
jgi:hypothetical protein